MCIKFYEIGKTKKGILRRALKMWYMFPDYNNMEKYENQLCPLVGRNNHPSCTKRLALQDGVRVLFSFRKKIN
jgi:hypothetical protein